MKLERVQSELRCQNKHHIVSVSKDTIFLKQKYSSQSLPYKESGLADDHMYLGFARITNSEVMTLDCKMIRSAKKGKVKAIDFREFLDEVMSPEKSPMTRLEEDRQYYNKKHAKTIELYGRLEG